jgi:aquaporin Z
MEVEGGH